MGGTSISNWFSQVAAVTAMSVRTLRERSGSTASTITGVAGVVAVLVGVLSIAEGFRKTLATAGSPDAALILRAGSDDEMMSIISHDSADIVAQAPGVARGAVGAGGAEIPLASAELFVVVDVPKKSSGSPANVPLRGVQPAALATHGDIRIVEGRMFEWGKNELIVGSGAADQFAGLGVGSVQRWGQNDWKVVGIFSSAGSLWESELWCDVAVLQPAYRRGNNFQSEIVKLASPGDFDRFKDALSTDPRLDLKVVRQDEYYSDHGRVLTKIIRTLGFTIAILMAIGAVFGALNTMYSAVASRTREIATLRAIGFRAGPVVVSILLESLLLAVVGGAIGGVAAYLGFNGYRAATLNWQTFSQVAFAFAVTPGLLLLGAVLAIVMGLVGGLFPAIRAARLPVTSALREA